jgi:uncharacterized protein
MAERERGGKLQLAAFEQRIVEKMAAVSAHDDPAHDILHLKRVVKTARVLCENEKARPEVVVPAAWLHDFVVVPKNDSRRKMASRLSAEAAVQFLREIQYPEVFLDEIAHAIAAHSFSANIETRTLEAKIVQDADRLDGLGAIGVARCFATAGLLGRPFYSEVDPLCEAREPDDAQFTVDHFFAKLFKTAETLKTEAGRREGAKRVEVMKRYLTDLAHEIK